jgi:non-specific serine/threonine protein kinase
MQGRSTEARALCAEGIARFQESGDRRGIAWCVGVLAGAEAEDGHALRAARLRGAMEGLLESVGAPVQESYHRFTGERSLRTMKDALGDDRFHSARAEGRAMSLSRAIRFALEQEP